MTVDFNELLEAFEFVSFGSMCEIEAYLCKQTGTVYFHFEDGDDPEKLPDDIEDEEKYISIPHKNDLNLGKRLVLDFVYQQIPNEIDEIQEIFSKKGAYSIFGCY